MTASLVITAKLGDSKVSRLLIDSCSSLHIIFPSTFLEMGAELSSQYPTLGALLDSLDTIFLLQKRYLSCLH